MEETQPNPYLPPAEAPAPPTIPEPSQARVSFRVVAGILSLLGLFVLLVNFSTGPPIVVGLAVVFQFGYVALTGRWPRLRRPVPADQDQ